MTLAPVRNVARCTELARGLVPGRRYRVTAEIDNVSFGFEARFRHFEYDDGRTSLSLDGIGEERVERRDGAEQYVECWLYARAIFDGGCYVEPMWEDWEAVGLSD